MDNNKFYTFVKNIVKDDEVLAESIITAHKMIFEGEEALDEGLGRMVGTAGLLASLLFGNAFAKNWTEEDVRAMAKESIQLILDEYVEASTEPGFDAEDDLETYKKAVKAYKKLRKKDQKLADLYARMIDQTLRTKFGLVGVGELAKSE